MYTDTMKRIRTNIYLSASQISKLKAERARTGASSAELVRRAVNRFVAQPKKGGHTMSLDKFTEAPFILLMPDLLRIRLKKHVIDIDLKSEKATSRVAWPAGELEPLKKPA